MSTPIDLDAIEAAAKAVPWQAGPWRAHQFEVECPLEDGCGDPHDCDEVETSDAEYPGAHVVAQIITTPGLGCFATPTAQYIALMYPATTLAMVAELRAARKLAAAATTYRLAKERHARHMGAWESEALAKATSDLHDTILTAGGGS